MNGIRIVKALLFLCAVSPVMAQQAVNSDLKLEKVTSKKVATSTSDISAQQMEALLQIEKEFAERELKRKRAGENDLAAKAMREGEREEKIKNILTPKQREKYLTKPLPSEEKKK